MQTDIRKSSQSSCKDIADDPSFLEKMKYD